MPALLANSAILIYSSWPMDLFIDFGTKIVIYFDSLKKNR